MIPRLRSTARATLVLISLLALMPLVPAPARAIQLRWSSGATDLTASQDTLAILVVQADSAEVTLPNSWRLLWTTDSLAVQFTAFDPNAACLVDTAKVDSITPPQTPADSAANQITAWFCSSGSNNAALAYFLADLPGGGHGKLKVVALDPTDTTQVIESNEVTFNGGVAGFFQPSLLSATQTRTSTTVSVTAIGADLGTVLQARIVGPDSSWAVPLTPTRQTSTSLIATADVPASLPPAVLEVSGGPGRIASTPLSGDQIEAPAGDYSYGYFRDSSGVSRPKDFAFFYDNLGHFHLFYIQHYITADADTNEQRLGHVWGTSLRNDWSKPDISSFSTAQSHAWDIKHVWAPTLIQMGPTYYLFYAGEDAQGNQAIGVATTDNINTSNVQWNRPTDPIISRDMSVFGWIDPSGLAQCRDPFVMVSPFAPDELVMLFTSQLQPDSAAIGVAWAHTDSLTMPWHNYGYLEIRGVSATELAGKAESPHAFYHVNARGDTSYYVCATGLGTSPTTNDRLLRNRTSPWDHGTDTGQDHWNKISSLYEQLGFATLDPVVFEAFNASEYCRMYKHEYIAAVNATPGTDSTYAVWITMVQWLGGGGAPDSMVLSNPVTSVDGGATGRRTPTSSGLRVVGRNPGTPPLALEMSMARRLVVELVVYDVLGRRVRKLAAGARGPGREMLQWNARDEGGRAVEAGIYFACMKWSGGQSVVRLVVMR